MENQELKKVELNNLHIELGARMVPFAGYNMPVQYSNLIQEHHQVRNQVGVFDVSHMGEVWVEGPEAFNLIQWLCSNDASKLVDGKVQYSTLLNETGGIVDDLLIYRFKEDRYLLVVNASNIEKDFTYIKGKNQFNCTVKNASDEYCLFAVQGPKALEVLNKISTEDLTGLPYYYFKLGQIGEISDIIISNTGYTGAGGFELYVKNENALSLWNLLFEAGEEFGIQPIGLGARDTLRTEMGFALYGNEIDDTTSPIEAGLGWITSFNKEFIAKDIHFEIKNKGSKNKLVAFLMEERGIPRNGYQIKNESGDLIGRVTSGTQSPTLSKAIGLGYVLSNKASLGNSIYIEIRNQLVKATIVKTPFI